MTQDKMKARPLSGYSFTTTASGDAEFFSEVAAPFAAAIGELLPVHREEVPEPIRISTATRNDGLSFAALGFTLFVASHLTKKVLDDVYTTVIQPRLKPLLEDIEARLRKKRAGKKCLNASVWYAEFSVLVSVSLVGDSFADIIKQLHLIPTIHANAVSWIRANGTQKPVHHYRIEGGKVNAVPLLADHVHEVLR